MSNRFPVILLALFVLAQFAAAVHSTTHIPAAHIHTASTHAAQLHAAHSDTAQRHTLTADTAALVTDAHRHTVSHHPDKRLPAGNGCDDCSIGSLSLPASTACQHVLAERRDTEQRPLATAPYHSDTPLRPAPRAPPFLI